MYVLLTCVWRLRLEVFDTHQTCAVMQNGGTTLVTIQGCLDSRAKTKVFPSALVCPSFSAFTHARRKWRGGLGSVWGQLGRFGLHMRSAGPLWARWCQCGPLWAPPRVDLDSSSYTS